jgi:uncharacterized membrane protein YhhN
MTPADKPNRVLVRIWWAGTMFILVGLAVWTVKEGSWLVGVGLALSIMEGARRATRLFTGEREVDWRDRL